MNCDDHGVGFDGESAWLRCGRRLGGWHHGNLMGGGLRLGATRGFGLSSFLHDESGSDRVALSFSKGGAM